MSSSTVRRGTAAPVAKSAANDEGKRDWHMSNIYRGGFQA
jgi:hypothetical protein